MEQLTQLETQLLKEIKKQDGNGEYILESRSKSQYLDILNITIPYKQLRGVLSSLVKKEYVKIEYEKINEHEEPFATIYLTEKAIKYYKNN